MKGFVLDHWSWLLQDMAQIGPTRKVISHLSHLKISSPPSLAVFLVKTGRTFFYNEIILFDLICVKSLSNHYS